MPFWQDFLLVFLMFHNTILLEFHLRPAQEPNSTAAAVSGVETNGAGDLGTFLTGLMTGQSGGFEMVAAPKLGRLKAGLKA